ncbi:MAG: hypothetical protein M1819_000678 [Sarea resinae]|nr:MAG: hypothetical protein M1819_000678 [Sarea resinae]
MAESNGVSSQAPAPSTSSPQPQTASTAAPAAPATAATRSPAPASTSIPQAQAPSSASNNTNATSNNAAATPTLPAYPTTSLHDPGTSKRPRDARLIHMVLASLGLSSYQDRVPLQLLDFAYRYTSSTLQDALHLSLEGYSSGSSSGPSSSRGAGGAGAGGTAGAGGGAGDSVQLNALRLAIASRLTYQFNPSLPKEVLLEMAQERNRVMLPAVPGKEWGVRLPHERYCLTGVGWGIKDEWESEGEEGDEMDEEAAEDEGEGEGDEGDARMEDVFGEDTGAGGGDGDGESADRDMADA